MILMILFHSKSDLQSTGERGPLHYKKAKDNVPNLNLNLNS